MTAERYLIARDLRLDRLDERVWLADKPVRLGGKATSLLRLLMERPQTLVTKEQIFDAVWDGLAVSESVLTTAIKELRQALGDDARKPVWIETAHRRGYRFLQQVTVADNAVANAPLSPSATTIAKTSIPPPRKMRVPMVIAAVLAAFLIAGTYYLLQPQPLPAGVATVAHAKSVAVLPFRDLSTRADQRWFAEGLTEEVRSRLVMTPDLHVVSRLTLANFRDRTGSLADKTRGLGVAHILNGSVRHVGGRVRVTVELVRAADGAQLWAQTYDRPAADVISIQEDIAFRIATALQTVMQPTKLRAMVTAGTRSVEAYQAYLQGVVEDQKSLATGSRVAAKAAADAYERARSIDPNFAKAHWRAAQNWFGKSTRIHGLVSGEGFSDAERLAQYMDRVQRAIATSADEPERLKYLSARAVMQMELREAHRLMASYLTARPRDIDAWEDMAELSAYANEHQWLVRTAERIHTLSIEARDPRSRAITVSAMAMQLDDAAARSREQMRLRPKSVMTRYQSHRALIWAGEIDEARQSLNAITTSELPEQNKLLARLRQSCADGQNDAARLLRQRLERSNPSLSDRWQAAQIVGDTEDAVALLQPLDNADGLLTLLQFMINPSFDSGRYVTLRGAMARDGVVRWKVWSMPGACKRSQIRSS